MFHSLILLAALLTSACPMPDFTIVGSFDIKVTFMPDLTPRPITLPASTMPLSLRCLLFNVSPEPLQAVAALYSVFDDTP